MSTEETSAYKSEVKKGNEISATSLENNALISQQKKSLQAMKFQSVNDNIINFSN